MGKIQGILQIVINLLPKNPSVSDEFGQVAPRPVSDLILDGNYGNIFISFFLYLIVSALVGELIWPVLFYCVTVIFGLPYILSSSFLLYFVGFGHLLIPYYCAVIFQARCFNANGVRVLTKKDLEGGGIYECKRSKSWLYCCIFFSYLAILIVIYIFYSENNIVAISFDFNVPLYGYLGYSSFLDYLSKQTLFSSIDKEFVVGLFGVGSFIYVTAFIFGFNLLVPRSIIVGIQCFIWKRER